ncbi:MAG TPA: hypothetical protein VMF30_04120 [Pirellulales bacterium]|nr:hypothetical protein [Pirellulales bacterium]
MGKVRIDGQPVGRVELIFHRQESQTATAAVGVPPTATTDADGSFRPTTYTGGDGLPAGDYIVTAGWPVISLVDGEETTGADRLGGRYAKVSQPAARITVKAGNNELAPFELKSH